MGLAAHASVRELDRRFQGLSHAAFTRRNEVSRREGDRVLAHDHEGAYRPSGYR